MAEAKPEEKKEEMAEEKKEEKPEEEKKKEPKPPSPCVLFVDLHCVGCAKKIERYIMKMRGSNLLHNLFPFSTKCHTSMCTHFVLYLSSNRS